MYRLPLRTVHTASGKKTTVEFFYDLASTYSYIHMELIKRQEPFWPSMDLKLTPVSIPFIMKGSGNRPPFVVPNKAKYLMKDFRLVSEYYKIPFGIRDDYFDNVVNVGTYRTQRFLVALQKISPEAHDKLVPYLFQRFFSPTNSANLFDVEVVKKVAEEGGVAKDLIEKALVDMKNEDTKLILKNNTDRVVEMGAFGLPVTLVHRQQNPEWVFGSDRLHIIGYLLGEKEPPVLPK